MSGSRTGLLSDEETTTVFMKNRQDSMPLDQVQRGGRFRVLQVNAENASLTQLMALGLVPGVEVRLTHRAPLLDPLAIEFGGCHVSLRREDAAQVTVVAC
jgi:Fe2+ transport system protein FeoA